MVLLKNCHRGIIFSLHIRLFGYEYMMELCVNDIEFVEVFVALQYKSFYKFCRVDGYLFNENRLCLFTKYCGKILNYFLGSL